MFDDLLAADRLRKEHTSDDRIAEYLNAADEEIAAARVVISQSRMVAFKAAYDALIHAGNALIRTYGFRPTARDTHVTIVECTNRLLGAEYGTMVRRFKQMRRARHALQYEAIFGESDAGVEKDVNTASRLVIAISEHINKRSPQKPLFK